MMCLNFRTFPPTQCHENNNRRTFRFWTLLTCCFLIGLKCSRRGSSAFLRKPEAFFIFICIIFAVVRITRQQWSAPLSPPSEGWMEAEGRDSPRVLLERRLRWLVEVLCGSSVFCWWLLSMGLVAMMLSLYLFIRASLVLSFTAVNRGADKHKSKGIEPSKQPRSVHVPPRQSEKFDTCEYDPEFKKKKKKIWRILIGTSEQKKRKFTKRKYVHTSRHWTSLNTIETAPNRNFNIQFSSFGRNSKMKKNANEKSIFTTADWNILSMYYAWKYVKNKK